VAEDCDQNIVQFTWPFASWTLPPHLQTESQWHNGRVVGLLCDGFLSGVEAIQTSDSRRWLRLGKKVMIGGGEGGGGGAEGCAGDRLAQTVLVAPLGQD
jgi:hypothetical protein